MFSMATIKEIAERAGVSIGTVDRGLHDRGRVSTETRETILRLVKEMDYKPNSVAQGLAIMRKKLKFSFFIIDPLYHPFFENVLKGALRKAEELRQYGIEVEIHKIGAYAVDEIPAVVQTDGIAMLPLPQLEPIRQWAKENAIPIVYYNIPTEDDSGLAYVGCDYEQAGRIAAGLCAITNNGRGTVAVLSEGGSSVISYRDRAKGFLQELKTRYPSIRLADCYVDIYSDLNTVAEKMLSEHPNLDTVYLINPGDYSVCRTIHNYSHNPHIKIITNDLTEQQRPMVESGLITATICQEPEKQGSEPLEILFQYLANGKLPTQKYCYTDLSIHISQNI